jgi:hypothetical protein
MNGLVSGGRLALISADSVVFLFLSPPITAFSSVLVDARGAEDSAVVRPRFNCWRKPSASAEPVQRMTALLTPLYQGIADELEKMSAGTPL